MFIGEYIHNLDPKRRLSIPAKFRKELGKRAVVTRGLDNCLFLYPMDEWKKVASKLAELPTGQKDTRSFVRLFLSGASLTKIVEHPLPKYATSCAGIVLSPNKKTAFVGCTFNVPVSVKHEMLLSVPAKRAIK